MRGEAFLVALAVAATGLAACEGTSGATQPASTGHAVGDVTITLTPASGASSAQLTSAADIVRARLIAQGVTARTAVTSGAIAVTVPASARGAVEQAALPGVLSLREIYPVADDTTSSRPSAEGTAAGTQVTGLNPPPDEPDQTAPSAATLAQYAALDCATAPNDRPATVDEDRHHFVVACDRTGQTKYLLTPADLTGGQVASANATEGQTSQGGGQSVWEVDLAFADSAVGQVEAVSRRLYANNRQQLAITLDGLVLSAPSTNGVLGKNITIAGGQPPFTHAEAEALASVVNAGPLPVALTVTGTG